MSFFKNLFKNKDKKSLYSLALIFIAGVCLLFFGGFFSQNPRNESKTQAKEETNIKMPETYPSYETDLEKRLENVLSLVEGAGKVKVMITLTHGKEATVQQDSKTNESETDEVDAAGGKRISSQKTSEDSTVMIRNSDGSETPLVLVETEPKVEGVIIIAEGGNNVLVKDALIKAAQTVLGLETHKVQVLKMK